MRFILLLLALTFISVAPLEAALAGPVTPTAAAVAPDLSRKAVEAQLGRKLKFTERIALGVGRRKAKKHVATDPDGRVLDGIALSSMIIGIVAFLTVPIGAVSIVLAGLALIMGIVGLVRVNRSSDFRKGKGFAIAGIALGGGFIVLLGLLIALIAASLGG